MYDFILFSLAMLFFTLAIVFLVYVNINSSCTNTTSSAFIAETNFAAPFRLGIKETTFVPGSPTTNPVAYPIPWTIYPEEFYDNNRKAIIIPLTGKWNISFSLYLENPSGGKVITLCYNDKSIVYNVRNPRSSSFSASVNLLLNQGDVIYFTATASSSLNGQVGTTIIPQGTYVTFALV